VRNGNSPAAFALRTPVFPVHRTASPQANFPDRPTAI
jgi:hypothetical protein